jgi:hypothetical protein
MINGDFTEAAGLVQPIQANIRFFMGEVKRGKKSDEEGRPIMELVEHISIAFPGSRDVFEGPVEEHHKRQYPQHYANWKKNSEEKTVVGTLLSEWPQISRSLVEQFNTVGVYTVEQLAGASDTALDRMGADSMTMHKKAKAWLELAKESASGMNLAKENKALLAKVDKLTAEMDEMSAKFEELTGKAPADVKKGNKK